jgi:hypothetical protein
MNARKKLTLIERQRFAQEIARAWMRPHDSDHPDVHTDRKNDTVTVLTHDHRGNPISIVLHATDADYQGPGGTYMGDCLALLPASYSRPVFSAEPAPSPKPARAHPLGFGLINTKGRTFHLKHVSGPEPTRSQIDALHKHMVGWLRNNAELYDAIDPVIRIWTGTKGYTIGCDFGVTWDGRTVSEDDIGLED